MRRNDVASTSFRHRVPTRFLINQCQIITFLILKYDIIENSRIELRGIVLPVQVGGLLGGPKGMLAPPLKLLGGGLAPPLPTPMKYTQAIGHRSKYIGQVYQRYFLWMDAQHPVPQPWIQSAEVWGEHGYENNNRYFVRHWNVFGDFQYL